jgi:hypothetical protein
VYTEDELNKLAEHVLSGGDPDELVIALRSRLSALVGMYVANWPDCLPFVDDMVSEGFLALTKLCNNIPEELFAKKSFSHIAISRAECQIERMLNAARSLSAPSAFTQLNRIKNGDAPIYLMAAKQLSNDNDVEDWVDYPETDHPEELGDENARDIFDVVCKIETEDEVDEYLLDDTNWGKTNVQLAEELGVTPPAVRYRREKLYKKFLELTE